jgi:hypothetical protein
VRNEEKSVNHPKGRENAMMNDSVLVHNSIIQLEYVSPDRNVGFEAYLRLHTSELIPCGDKLSWFTIHCRRFDQRKVLARTSRISRK